MNSGILDISHLIHTIKTVEDNPACHRDAFYDLYETTRMEINKQYLGKALSNYRITQDISSSLGFTPQILKYFPEPEGMLSSVLSYLPKPTPTTLNNLRLRAMKLAFRSRTLPNPALKLFFDQFDYEVQRTSPAFPSII